MQIGIIILIGFFTLALATVSLLIFTRFKRKKHSNSVEFVTFEVRVAKSNELGGSSFERLLSVLHSLYLKKRDSIFSKKSLHRLSVEIVSETREILIYISGPKKYKNFLETQVMGAYPNAMMKETDNKVVNFEKNLFGKLLQLKNSFYFPLKTTGPKEGTDSITNLLNSMLAQTEDETNLVQIVFSPQGEKWRKGAKKYLGNFITQSKNQEIEEKDQDTEILKKSKVKEKIEGIGFKSEIRVFSSKSPEKAHSIASTFFQFNNQPINNFEISNIKFSKQKVEKREFFKRGFVLSSKELAEIVHLPTKNVTAPGLKWLLTIKREPPKNIPTLKNTKKEDLSTFGVLDFRDRHEKYGIHIKDRSRHLYIVGKSGTGKSTLIQNLVIDDIRIGRGVAILDPHGDVVEEIMSFIPSSRTSDVIILDPRETERPIQLNIFDVDDPKNIPLIASSILAIFKKIWGESSWGPRLEYILRNAVLALLLYPEDTSLINVTELLTNKKFRDKVLDKVEDPVVKGFFKKEYDRYDEKFRQEAIASVLNKIGQFLTNPTIRRIIGTTKSSIDIRQIMDEGKILLANLSVGSVGEDVTTFLGSILITKIQLAAMARADMPESERRNFYLFVDEFQNFATDSFATILSEARKYRLNIIMANQYLEQLSPELLSAIFGNVGSMITFRIGANDARKISAEMAGVFAPEDLIGLSNYEVAVKMTINNEDTPAFSGKTLPPPEFLRNKNKEKIIRVSREMWGRKSN